MLFTLSALKRPIDKLTFRALALRQSESRDYGLRVVFIVE